MNPAVDPRKTESHKATKKGRCTHDRWESLSAAIEANAPLLVGQGDLVLKQIGARRYWYLRFLAPRDERGHRRHRSLYVGREDDQELVTRVRVMLETGRAARRRIEEIAGIVKIVATLERAVRGSLRGLGAIEGCSGPR